MPKLERQAVCEDRGLHAAKTAVLHEMRLMREQGQPLDVRKRALRLLQIQWHPDKNPDRPDMAKSVFQFIEDAKGWFLHVADLASAS